jgi:hypothetical protein
MMQVTGEEGITLEDYVTGRSPCCWTWPTCSRTPSTTSTPACRASAAEHRRPRPRPGRQGRGAGALHASHRALQEPELQRRGLARVRRIPAADRRAARCERGGTDDGAGRRPRALNARPARRVGPAPRPNLERRSPAQGGGTPLERSGLGAPCRSVLGRGAVVVAWYQGEVSAARSVRSAVRPQSASGAEHQPRARMQAR